MMLFLANENMPQASVTMLRQAGCSVAFIPEDIPGASDQKVLSRTAKENRIILTFDRDYGELIYRRKLPVPSGVVYFRLIPATPEEAAKILLWIIQKNEIDLTGRFSIIERDKIRQRPL